MRALQVEEGTRVKGRRQLLEAKKEGYVFSPRASGKECNPVDTLVLAQGDSCGLLVARTAK